MENNYEPASELFLKFADNKDTTEIPIQNVVPRVDYWRKESAKGQIQKDTFVAEAKFTGTVAEELIDVVDNIKRKIQADTSEADKVGSVQYNLWGIATEITTQITDRARKMTGTEFVSKISEKCRGEGKLLDEDGKLKDDLSMAELIVARRVIGSAYDNGRGDRGILGQSVELSGDEYKRQLSAIQYIASNIVGELTGEQGSDARTAVTVKTAPKTS